MELDDLKTAWKEYDNKLSHSLKLNEELLRKLNLNKSHEEMKRPLQYEIAGVCINFLALVYMISTSFKYIDLLKFSIPGFFGVIFLTIYTLLAILKVSKLSRVNYFSEPISELQRKIFSLKSLVLNYRKLELYLITPLVATMLPILFIDLYQIDIYVEKHWFFIELIAIVGIVFPLTFWLNKVIYDKRMKNTEDFLSEIAEFTKE